MSLSRTSGQLPPRSQSGKTEHLPSLDGLRAISISLVLLGHLNGTRGFATFDLGIGNYAQLGVFVFFVISGFLITRLMLLEHIKNGRVSLKLFYERRALRLFPASYAFIGIVSLLTLAGIFHLRPTDLWHAATYTVNFLPNRGKQIGHLWSLSVEEQFYMIWPLTFVLLGPKRARWAILGVILLGPVARSCDWLFLRGTPYHDLEMFPMVADSLAMGCLLAKVSGWLETKNWYLQLFRPVYSIGLVAVVLILHLLFARCGWTGAQLEADCIRGRAQLFALSVAAAVSQPRIVFLDCGVSAKPHFFSFGGSGVLFPVGEALAQVAPPLACSWNFRSNPNRPLCLSWSWKRGQMIEIVASMREEPSAPHAARGDLRRVLLVVDQLAKTLGGGERIVLKLAALLPEYGYRASILTFFADPESPALQSPPCDVYLLPLNSTFNLSALRGAFELRRFLRREHIEIVQTFFESSDIWAGFVTKALSNAKLIWARRDMGILRTGKHRAAYRLLAWAPDAVFAVSEQVRRHAIEVDRIAPGRVLTIYNGLNLSEWNAAEGRDSAREPAKILGGCLVATVGNIRRVKGHDVFIRAAAEVVRQFPTTRFSIAGEVLEPGYYAELQSLVQDLSLGEHVRFEGSITNLREHLGTAGIFVLPSRSEGFSNAIVEAMAASLPVVATDVGGNAEAVEDGVSGFIVPSDDPGALAGAILRLLSDPSLAKTMGAAGKGLVAEKFTTEAMLDRVTAVYAKLLSGG
jgi:glycosyltransferase involved in cell wall biosynthesis/peptidoglycan/LPS O-acetylase OafA/YrhL